MRILIRPLVNLFVCSTLLTFALSSPLAAQSFEAVGTRAQGMAGAFVAVADDASATWWNPAGLAGGPYVNSIVEYGQMREPADPLPTDPAARNSTTGFAVAFPALGTSYYRLRVSQAVPADSIGAAEPGRQDQGPVGAVLRSVSTTAIGLTVGQSLGSHIVLGSTVRLLRAGSVVATAVEGGDDPLDQADDLDVPRDTNVDVDFGVLMRFGALRLGGAVKHLAEPGFGEGTERIELKRVARGGVALMTGKHGMVDSLIGAFDMDVTESESLLGNSRRMALGGELGVVHNRVLLRGGLGTTTADDREWSQTLGASVAIRSGTFVDSAFTPGSGEERAGWSVSLRSTF